MANELEKSIFFPGGKIVFPETNDNTPGLKFEKNDDGSWRVTMDIIISKEEATDILRKFHEFVLEENDVFEEIYHNQVFFEAFDDAGKSIDIKFRKIELNVLNAHKTEEGGIINFRMTPETGVGKTQNPNTKVQNAGTVIHPAPTPGP